MTPGSKPRKLKLLIVVWGEQYIEEFTRVALPSLMAPGNLPALACAADFEILILTTEATRLYFTQQEPFHRLKAIAPVRFLEIGDLVTNGQYGVTLTYAYARGIMDSGDEQTNTTFVFMNSDFVLSDGSLAHLRKLIEAGNPCIMAASLRARSEMVLPRLLEAVDTQTELLSMPSRDMVGLAMSALHPTVLGKTVTQNFVGCLTYNQLYWPVNENTLLGRYHLIFMLAISPERPLTVVNSYCDYGFVPEMVPSGRFCVIDDSDDFFMLELQPTAQEQNLLLGGHPSKKQIADGLSSWTTREHRAFANMDTVFHSAELPSDLDRVRLQAKSYMRGLQRKMRQTPVSHVDHRYWVGGVDAWQAAIDAMQKSPQSSPNMPTMTAPASHSFSIMGVIRIGQRLTGFRPFVSLWHHNWLDYNLALRWAARVKQSGGKRTLIVGATNDPLPTALSHMVGGELISPEGIVKEDSKSFDYILIHSLRKDVRGVGEIVERALRILASGGQLALYVEHRDADTDPSNFSNELTWYATDILPADWSGLNISRQLVGGYTKRNLRIAERFFLRRLIPVNSLGIPASLIAFVAWPVIAFLTLLNNSMNWLINLCFPARRIEFASSALIEMSRKRKPGHERHFNAEIGASPSIAYPKQSATTAQS